MEFFIQIVIAAFSALLSAVVSYYLQHRAKKHQLESQTTNSGYSFGEKILLWILRYKKYLFLYLYMLIILMAFTTIINRSTLLRLPNLYEIYGTPLFWTLIHFFFLRFVAEDYFYRKKCRTK